MEGVTCYFTKSLLVVSSLFSSFVPQRDTGMLYCWDGVDLHKNSFDQLMLCVNMHKIKHLMSDSRSLNQHWLRSLVLHFLLAAHSSSLCEGSRDPCRPSVRKQSLVKDVSSWSVPSSYTSSPQLFPSLCFLAVRMWAVFLCHVLPSGATQLPEITANHSKGGHAKITSRSKEYVI